MQRNYFIDNIKFILILLVVIGHFIEPYILLNEYIYFMYFFIYSFHMPLFAFVSGIFSKKIESFYQVKKSLLQIVKLQLFYGFIIGIFILIDPTNMSYFQSEVSDVTILSFVKLVFTPIWLLWYLLALLIWRILLRFFKPNLKFLFLSFVFYILIGFGKNIEGVFALHRALTFFVYFMIAQIINPSILLLYRKKLNFSPLFLVFTIPIFYIFTKNINVEFLYFSSDYFSLFENIFYAIILKIIFFLWTIYISFTLLCLISTKEKFYSKYGSSSFNTYIGHGLIFIIITFLGYFNLQFNLINLLILSVLTFYLCNTSTFKKIISYFY